MKIKLRRESRDGLAGSISTLYVLQLPSGLLAEFATFHHNGLTHFCVSTQLGCPVGCRHCATTYSRPQYVRNLTTEEVGEAIQLLRAHTSDRSSPFVASFSGHGEPLLNWNVINEVIESLKRELRDDVIFHLTTVGIKESFPGVLSSHHRPRIYLSLHGGNDRIRGLLIPRHTFVSDCEGVVDFANEYNARGGTTAFNYVLTAENTTEDSSDAVVQLIEQCVFPAEIRLFRLNNIGVPSRIHAPDEADIEKFVAQLKRRMKPDCNVRITNNRGNDCGIACGQLRAGAL